MSSGGLYTNRGALDELDNVLVEAWEEPEFRAGYIKAVRKNRTLRQSSFSGFEWNLLMATKDDKNVDDLLTEIYRNDDAADAQRYALRAAQVRGVV